MQTYHLGKLISLTKKEYITLLEPRTTLSSQAGDFR